jgi:hypothetical protein
MTVRFATKSLFNDDPSPVYTISAYDFAPFSSSISGTPAPGAVLSFMNHLVAPQTRRGDQKWAISSCARQAQ